MCIVHLRRIKEPNSRRQQPVHTPPLYTPPTALVPSRNESQSQAHSRLGRTGTYVMRKSASNAGIRPPSFVSTSSSTASNHIPSPRPQNERPPPNRSPWSSLDVPHVPPWAKDQRSGNMDSRGGRNMPSSTNGILPSTPGESPPSSRPDRPSYTSRLAFSYDGSNDFPSQTATQSKALRTPRSRSREPDTRSSTTTPLRPSRSTRDRESDDYVPSAHQSVSHLRNRLQNQARSVVRENGQLTSSSQQPLAGFSLDTYVYSQHDSVSPLPPPPGVTVSSASDIASAAHAASAAAALQRSYAAAMAAVSRVSDPSLSSSSPSLPDMQSQDLSAPDYIYAYVDPRIHWTRARSEEWHALKQAEIKARGGRKANLGMAADRTARQKLKLKPQSAAEEHPEPSEQPPDSELESETTARSVPSVWQGELPSNVVHNKDWMALVSSFANDEEKRLRKAKRQALLYRQRYGN